jgi:uncharacterized short protein YbdD (DUF466 family)
VSTHLDGNAPSRLARVVAAVRRVAGMPDYAAYVAHLRECHPERAVPDEREYYEMYLERKYQSGGSRCC